MAKNKNKKKAAEESSDLHALWLDEIDRYEREAERWKRRAKDIVRRYKDDRERNDYRIRYNILWSNVQVLKPALYSQNPIPRVERRFKDGSPIAKVASDLLERCLGYSLDCTKYGDVMRQCVHDRLLVGRGTAWVRYVPHFRDAQMQESPELASDGEQVTSVQEQGEPEDAQQELYYEEAIPDFVHWEDFGHTFGRTWEEVRGVWRIAYLTRAELIERFGEDVGNAVPLDHKPGDDKRPDNDTKQTENMHRAAVYEIWDKQTKQVIWLNKGYSKELDVRDDPLGLEDFFPCPMPMLANLANDTIIPTPDYAQYQDQAAELDELTMRVGNVAKDIKVAGVYDAKAEGISRIFTEGVEHKLIPVNQWTSFAERGGLKSAMDLLPTKEMSDTLITLYEAREKTKADLYEITGISDIIRGFSSGNAKTATEQQIKSQFANLRLSEQQREVQRFARDLLKIMGEIMAFKFTPETLMRISGVKLLSQEQKQQFQAQQQQMQQRYQALVQQGQQVAQQTGQQPPAPQQPQLPPDVQKLMALPALEEVTELLRNHADFGFSIEIETDSTINTDLQYEREQANDLLQSVGTAAQGLTLAVQGGVLSADQARAIFKATMQKHHFSKDVDDALEMPFQAQPDPKAQEFQQQQQLEQQKAQAQMQVKQQELQAKARAQQQEMQNDQQMRAQEIAGEQQLNQQKLAGEQSLAQQRLAQEKELGILKIQNQPKTLKP